MEEPSVLDYVKSRLNPRQEKRLALPQVAAQSDSPGADTQSASPAIPVARAATAAVPWRIFLALSLAWIAQISLEPRPERSPTVGIVLYLLAAGLTAWSAWKGEWRLSPIPDASPKIDPLTVRIVPAILGLALAGLTFFTSGDNEFTWLNLGLLLAALASLLWAFWPEHETGWLSERFKAVKSGLATRQVVISNWTWLLLGALLLGILFRFWQLSTVPSEMTSDHTEKLLDVMRVLEGETKIFFPTNGGREALHFYWLTALHRLLNLDLNYMLLKVSTVLVGLAVLPVIYLIGKAIAGPRVGLLAIAFAGVAYWPNVISRVGLRFPFYVLFTALAVLFLIHGLRQQSRANFILAGISLGLGFYGYSADRLLPLLALAAVGLYLLHRESKGYRLQTAWLALIMIFFMVLLMLPLIRYMIDSPDSFLFRTLTRMSGAERPLPGAPLAIFFSNLGRALVMFFWDDGEVWLASVPHRPALEIAIAGLFLAGCVLVFVRVLRSRHWLDAFLLISIPLLMLPSILALAFPAENPNLYRTGGAIVPVFLIIGFAADGLMSACESWLNPPKGRRIAWALVALLLAWTAYQGSQLTFVQYAEQYRLSAWNTSELGKVMRGFSELTGRQDNAWIIPYPHWVDTRLVGITAGFPEKDYALYVEQLENTRSVPGAKLFLLKPEDQAAISALQAAYPNGWLQTYQSQVPSKEFLVFMVPPD